MVRQLNIQDKKVYEALKKKFWFIASGMFDWAKYGGLRPQGDILDSLFLCICQMHNLTGDCDLSRLIGKASDKQKEIFFLRVFRGCSPQTIACCLDVTDRNVRDIMDRVVGNIRKGIYDALTKRQVNNVSLTQRERDLIDGYKDKPPKAKKTKKPPKK